MADRITYVGLDVHKDSIVVAVAAGGLRGQVLEYCRIANTSAALERLRPEYLIVDGGKLAGAGDLSACAPKMGHPLVLAKGVVVAGYFTVGPALYACPKCH
jgi:hypothetical protein